MGVSLALPSLKAKKILEPLKVIFPVFREPLHWAMIIFDTRLNTMNYYDSLQLDGTKYLNLLKDFVTSLRAFYFLDQVEISVSNKSCPKQTNGIDCGVFVLWNSRMLVQNGSLNRDDYSQDDIGEIRKIIKAEILSTELISFDNNTQL